MKLPILTDPDLQEALTNARVCQGNDRDDALRVIAVTLFGLDSPTARLVLEEVSPEMRVFAWLAICELVDDSTAIDDGLKSADLYVERKPTKEEPAPLQREDLRRFFEVLRACRNENWPLARSIADEVQSMLLHLEVLEAIADISELSEDQAAAEACSEEVEEVMEEREASALETAFFTELRNFKKPRTAREKLESRSRRLKRLMELNAPEVVVFNEMCMVASSGGVDQALEVMTARKIELDEDGELAASLATGYALNGDLVNARKYAGLAKQPNQRYRGFMQIYATKQIS